MADSQPAEKAPRQSIQSVETGVRVLEALVEAGHAMQLRDVAAAADLSRSQAHRYLLAYVNTGLVQQDPGTGLYDLGATSLRIGMAALSRLDAVQAGVKALKELVQETGRTGILAIWGDFGPTVIRWLDGPRPIITSLNLGSVLPVLTSSVGQTFLSYLPAARTADVLRREQRLRGASEGPDPKQVRAEVRSAGYAFLEDMVAPGLRDISAPILDLQGNAVTVITLIARATEPLEQDIVITSRLLELTSQASSSLGWQGD